MSYKLKNWKIVQLFPRDTDPKFGLLREDEHGNIHYLHLNGQHRKKLFVYSASFEVFYVHLTRDQYTTVWESQKSFLPNPACISQIGKFADEDADTDYSEIMDILYK